MGWVLYRILVIVWILAVIFIIYIQHPLFWASPKWKRLEMIKKSKHFVNGQFKNLSKTPLMTYSKSKENLSNLPFVHVGILDSIY